MTQTFNIKPIKKYQVSSGSRRPSAWREFSFRVFLCFTILGLFSQIIGPTMTTPSGAALTPLTAVIFCQLLSILVMSKWITAILTPNHVLFHCLSPLEEVSTSSFFAAQGLLVQIKWLKTSFAIDEIIFFIEKYIVVLCPNNEK